MKVEDYRITSDEHQVIVNKVRRDDKGEISMVTPKGKTEPVEAVKLVGYYGTLTQALSAIQRNYLLDDGINIENVKDYCHAMAEITRKFEEEIQLGEAFR